MNSLKHKREKRHHSKKDKKLIKLIKPSSESEDEGSEHELSYYLNDRVKMMREVLKIIKPKKIRSMTPDCMKRMDNEEINSMLLEELLGISNKRLRYIFNGQNLNEESSSTDPEDQPVDIISLDDISDDDLIIDLDSDDESKKKTKKHKTKIKEEPKKKKVKKEKQDKEKDVDKNKKSEKNKKVDTNTEPNPMSEKNLMSVLELLELQARARAIKSQLALESARRPEPEPPKEEINVEEEEDAVIVESPKNEEIIITSSDSETERPTEETENEVVSDSDREKNAVTKNKIQVIQQTTIKEGQGTSDSFWKNSDRDNTKSSNVTIIQQTTIKEADQNGVHSFISNKDGDSVESSDQVDTSPKENNESADVPVAEIPLPENFTPEAQKSSEPGKVEKVQTLENERNENETKNILVKSKEQTGSVVPKEAETPGKGNNEVENTETINSPQNEVQVDASVEIKNSKSEKAEKINKKKIDSLRESIEKETGNTTKEVTQSVENKPNSGDDVNSKHPTKFQNAIVEECKNENNSAVVHNRKYRESVETSKSNTDVKRALKIDNEEVKTKYEETNKKRTGDVKQTASCSKTDTKNAKRSRSEHKSLSPENKTKTSTSRTSQIIKNKKSETLIVTFTGNSNTRTIKRKKKVGKNLSEEGSTGVDDCESIILDVDESEMDCINLD